MKKYRVFQKSNLAICHPRECGDPSAIDSRLRGDDTVYQNNYLKYYINLLFLFLLLMLVFIKAAFALSNDQDAGLEDNLSFYLYDDIDLISTLKFEYGKQRMVIKAVFPQLVSDTDRIEVASFNNAAENIVKEEIQFYRNKIKDLQVFKLDKNSDKLSNNFYIDYNSAYLRAKKENILSVRYALQTYIGAQSLIYTNHRSLNYNLTTMQEINLKDLFLVDSNYLSVLSKYCREVLTKHLKQKDNIDAGTMPIEDNYKVWNLTAEGLLLTFDEGQVAPNLYGTQTVLVPYGLIINLLAKNTPMTYCFSHRLNCFRGHLVTGGFIDEALNTSHSRFNPVFS